MKTPEEFWARVEVRGAADCWLWTGAKNTSGYGSVNWRGKIVTAHRLAAYFAGLVNSPSAPFDRRGTGFILHSCDAPACCNEKHFSVGSYSRNQEEAYARRRRAPFRGGSHANAKISNAQAADIRRRWKAGERQVDLAVCYGMSQVAISLVCRRKTYG